MEWFPPPELPEPEYPFQLNTGRLVYHWHTRTKTARVPHLHLAAPEAFVEVHPIDAARLGLAPGERVRVESRRGAVVVPVRITDTVRPGEVFIPFHYGGLYDHQAANELTLDAWDVVSKQPLFKSAAACRIRKQGPIGNG